jgi:hypothetical protein
MPPALKRLSLKAPPPRAVFLPDTLFFVRVIPIAEGTPPTDLSNQIELALEAMAPFPLAQMYHAHHWRPGAQHAVVYAAYKKRFTAEQTEAWNEAEIVLPHFAAFLTAKVEPSTAVVLTLPEGLTILHWGADASMPSQIIVRPWVPESSPAERRLLRDELVRSLGGTRNVVELDSAPVVEGEAGRSLMTFRAGQIEAPVTREQLDLLDVRDKEDLAARRAARRRDLILWRTFVACVAGVILAGLLELAVIGGRVWLRSRQAVVERQAPAVAEIMRAQSLATRIEELSTKRLRPLEMIVTVASRKPQSVLFSRATTSDLYTLDVEAYTNSPGDVSTYQAALRSMPEIEKVDVQSQRISDGTQVFRILVTFKPDAFTAPKS